jgi:hypothetical protein
MRQHAAIILNLLVPGTGLILLRREWLGVALAGLYGVLVQLGLWGCLIEPARMPTWLAACGLLGGGSVWLAAQLLARQRLSQVRNPELVNELAKLRDQACEHVSNGRYEEAWSVLRVALAINDEDLGTVVQVAELMTTLGRWREARRAWHHVEQLDDERIYRRRLVDALGRLPAR